MKAMAMERKQIYLDQGSDAKLKKLAKARGVSEASLIREAIARYLVDQEIQAPVPDEQDPLLALIGLHKGEAPPDAAINHDRYLYIEDMKP